MSNVYVIADLHFGHTNMAAKRGFNSSQLHDEFIIHQWNSIVNKRDIVWILGDITMERSHEYPLLARLNGLKKVVLGNHDKPNHVQELLKYVNCVNGIIKYKGAWLTHCPVHPMELEHRVKYNIHGHIHEKQVLKKYQVFGKTIFSKPDPRYICVSCERVDYQPVLISNILK